MRYFIVTYYRRSGGRASGDQSRMDEVVAVANRIKPKELQTASVIMDFAQQQILKCSVGDQVGGRDWSHIRDYYHRHYKDTIMALEDANEKSHHTD